MLTNDQIDKLKSNWGEKADAMQCSAEVRFYDTRSPWQCYIYAINPQDEDEICCIIDCEWIEVCMWSFSDISLMYNSIGEPPLLDAEYRPRMASDIFKQLSACKAVLQGGNRNGSS